MIIHIYTYTSNHTQEAMMMSGYEIIDTHNNIQTPALTQGITTDLYVKFIQYLDVKPKTVETYTKGLRQLQKYFMENNIQHPQRQDIINFRDELNETLKPTTIQSYLTSTKLFFRWLEQEGIYPNIADNIKGVKIDQAHKKDYLTSEQVRDVLSNIDRTTLTGKRDYAIVSLAVTGGLRTIEMHRANIEDIRTRGNHVVLYVQGKGKDEKNAPIKIYPPVEKAIREYLKARDADDPSEPLFTSTSNNSNGKSLSTRSLSGIIKKAMQEVGLDSDRLTAHSLRHTAVTLALLEGEDLQEVQQFARHSNISTTMIYNHSLNMENNSVGETISKSIFS